LKDLAALDSAFWGDKDLGSSRQLLQRSLDYGDLSTLDENTKLLYYAQIGDLEEVKKRAGQVCKTKMVIPHSISCHHLDMMK